MALKGTIKDFGVADIFQLISQQAKTGVLVLRNDVDEVRVSFKDGALVGASHSIRTAEMLLGNLMVRAEVLGQAQLDEALREQQRTLQRLGAVLVGLGMATQDEVKEFARLQMTEVVYSLFEWTVGTYEFDTESVSPSPDGVAPIRAETVVMNGIRMTDEWPGIREKIPSYTWLVEPMRALPDAPPPAESDEFDLSSIGFDGGGGVGGVDEYERRVFELIAPGRNVQKIIDLSRIGEFETCNALSALMSGGYIRVIKPPDTTQTGIRRRQDASARARQSAAILGRVVLGAGIVVVAALFLAQIPMFFGAPAVQGGARFVPAPVDDRVAASQLRVLRRAVEVYRYQTGQYPERLEQLVEADLVEPDAIRFPFEEAYFYKATDAGVTLLRPYR